MMYPDLRVKSVSCWAEFHPNCKNRISPCYCTCHITYPEKEFSVDTYQEIMFSFTTETWYSSTKEENYVEKNEGNITNAYLLLTSKCAGTDALIRDANLYLSILKEICSDNRWGFVRYSDLVEETFGGNVTSSLEVFKDIPYLLRY